MKVRIKPKMTLQSCSVKNYAECTFPNACQAIDGRFCGESCQDPGKCQYCCDGKCSSTECNSKTIPTSKFVKAKAFLDEF